jgi:hypothetical protein
MIVKNMLGGIFGEFGSIVLTLLTEESMSM